VPGEAGQRRQLSTPELFRIGNGVTDRCGPGKGFDCAGRLVAIVVAAALGMGFGDGDGLLQRTQGEQERGGGGPQEVVPPAGHEVAPRQEPRRRQEGGRGQIQEGLRGLRGTVMLSAPAHPSLPFPVVVVDSDPCAFARNDVLYYADVNYAFLWHACWSKNACTGYPLWYIYIYVCVIAQSCLFKWD
jgi:hypothetical protein